MAHQLNYIASKSTGDATRTCPNFQQLRTHAASYMRDNRDQFLPFLDDELASKGITYDTYCDIVASPTASEWGGQLELLALSRVLKKPILVYDVTQPMVTMGAVGLDESDSTINIDGAEIWSQSDEPIRLSFHRHFYALGEHYNSVCCV